MNFERRLRLFKLKELGARAAAPIVPAPMRYSIIISVQASSGADAKMRTWLGR